YCHNDAACDGVPDDQDECEGDNKLDADHDGVPDACDICPGHNDNKDSDHDGTPNGCDLCPNNSHEDCEDDSHGHGNCEETAYMKGDYSFDDLDFGNNKWGWAEKWKKDESKERTFELWSGAAHNDSSK